MSAPRMRWWTTGDLDGFFGLAVDNLVQLLVIHALCSGLLGFDDGLLFGKVLPGVAVSLLIGNLYYAWQAKRLGDREARNDVCALPYGINTPSVFAYALLVMLPAKLAAEAAGATPEEAARIAWQAGLVACLGSGLIEAAGSVAAERIRQAAPRAALLSTLAGIAVTFISIGFLFQTFAHPVVGLSTLSVVLIGYFGGVRFRGRLPTGLVAVSIGTALCWLTGTGAPHLPTEAAAFHVPVPVFGDLLEAFSAGHLATYLSIILPMGIFNVIGSLQNIESAEAGGDRFATGPALAMNGVGTIGAALFGSCFPTTIYIGHPGWKAMGARAGYSVANGLFITLICLTGTVGWVSGLVPIDAAMAIVLWIGIVITAQAFTATPRSHAPAVVVGLLPGIAAWGALQAKTALRVAGYGTPNGPSMADEAERLLEGFAANGQFLSGSFALEQGFIFTAMILAAVVVMIIERRFATGAIWCLAGAMFSATGLMHSYQWIPADTVIALEPAWPWAIGYSLMGAILLATPWITRPSPPDGRG